MPTATNITFFKTPATLRIWFVKNHDTVQELWIGFYKKDSGKTATTYREALDEALCFGWIDGIRKSVNELSYTNRFTPRKEKSTWSAVNIKRVGELKKLKLMKPPGLKAFEKRDVKQTNLYSFEQQKNPKLPATFVKQFKENTKAWKYFSSQPPWYQRISVWLVISAKQEKTKLNRLTELIKHSENETTIPQLTRKNYNEKKR
ncbi:MAG: YdeI/OmpD-associated family protein [Bacteroidota bacterium]|nr:YdeI/OmpD-associated family protein [Bacteroidota bacterium]